MNDFELLIFLLIWSAMILFLYEMFKSGAVEKILENFVNEIDPDVERVTRCQNCKYYNDKVNMCFLHWDIKDDEGFSFTAWPENYCAWAEKREE